MDATGNGAYLAEVTAQKFGDSIIEVHMTASWYRTNMPAYIEAFTDRTVVLPQNDDVLRDHQALAYVGDHIKVPDDLSFKGSDGLDRHGDTAIAGALAFAASRADLNEYGYVPQSEATEDLRPAMFQDDSRLPMLPRMRGVLD